MVDSSGTVDCNVLDSNCQKQSVHAASETLWGSLDSTSRSHAADLPKMFPPHVSNVGNEIEKSISTQHSHHFGDANAFVEEACANCNNNDKTSPPPPLDFMSKNKCLPVHSIIFLKVKRSNCLVSVIYFSPRHS